MFLLLRTIGTFPATGIPTEGVHVFHLPGTDHLENTGCTLRVNLVFRDRREKTILLLVNCCGPFQRNIYLVTSSFINLFMCLNFVIILTSKLDLKKVFSSPRLLTPWCWQVVSSVPIVVPTKPPEMLVVGRGH